MKVGESPIGQAWMHLPQPMHTDATLLSHSPASRNNSEELVFVVQTFKEKTGSPIIGPPDTMRAQFSSASQKAASSRRGVPFLTQKLPGFFAAPPLIVITRS